MPLAQEALSERRRRILDGIVAGKTNPVLADELGLTLDGVKWHVSEMLGELGLSSRQELAGWWRSERAKERVPAGIAAASFTKRALTTSARIALIGGITAAIVIGIYLAATHGSAGAPAATRSSPPQLAYITVEAPSGDLSSVVSRLYTVEPGKSPSLVRQYPGHSMYEMIASPDGRYIAVTDGNMVILDRQGNVVMRLGVAAVSFSGAGPFASWSADSRLFAYTRLAAGAPPRDPQGWVEVVDVAARTVMTSDALKHAGLSMPSWSPAGTRFAAVAAAAPPSRATTSIVIAGPNGDATTLTDKPLGGMAMPLWSPDGKWIAYWLPNGAVMLQGGQRRRLEEAMAIVPAGGGEPRLLAEASYPSPQAWSPSGRRIAMTCLKPVAVRTPGGASVARGGICIADPSGGNPATLTGDSAAFGAAFAPDGRSVAYLTDRDAKTGSFTLKMVDAQDRQVRTIASGVLFGGFTWLATQP